MSSSSRYDLLDWHDWGVRKRRLLLELACLGGASLRNARDELGLDQGPMYDNVRMADGQMQLYDVDDERVVRGPRGEPRRIAAAIGRDADADREQGGRRSIVSFAIVTHLWDEESGAYVNASRAACSAASALSDDSTLDDAPAPCRRALRWWEMATRIALTVRVRRGAAADEEAAAS